MASSDGVFTGSFKGTGSSLTIATCPFRPKKIVLNNITGNCDAEWQQSMPDAAMRKTVDSGSGATDVSYVTSNGITPTASGFTLGADTDLNVAAEEVHFTCWG